MHSMGLLVTGLSKLFNHSTPDQNSERKRINTMSILHESPVSSRLKELPRGNGNWNGYAHIYAKLSAACERMARTPYIYLSDEHINTMAVLGCGHEETMKAELHRVTTRRFIPK